MCIVDDVTKGFVSVVAKGVVVDGEGTAELDVGSQREREVKHLATMAAYVLVVI